MEKKASSIAIDLEEWDLLHDDHGFLSVSHEGGGKSLISDELRFDDGNGVVDLNYFICPVKQPKEDWDAGTEDKRLVVAPICQEPDEDIQVIAEGDDDDVAKEFKHFGVVSPPPPSPPVLILADHGVISEILYKKRTENEFADMTMEPPKPKPQVELNQVQFDGDEQEEVLWKGEDADDKLSKKPSMEDNDLQEGDQRDDNGGKEIFGVSTCQWKVTGIGALCSIGAAAATICILMLGGRQSQQQHGQNHELQFQIYAEDKRIKQVVQHATRLNQALSAVRGAPMMTTRANISFGGYYDGL